MLAVQRWQIPEGAGSKSVNEFTDANLQWQALNKNGALDGGTDAPFLVHSVVVVFFPHYSLFFEIYNIFYFIFFFYN